MHATIRPATSADASAQPVTPQGQAGSSSDVASFQDSIVAAISASKEQDGSKSQGGKATRERNGNADGSQSSDSHSGSAQNDPQVNVYVPAIYTPIIQVPEVQPAAVPASGTGSQDGTDASASAVNAPAQQEPLSSSAQILASTAQILATAPRSVSNTAVTNSTLPGNSFSAPLPNNTLKGTFATACSKADLAGAVPSNALMASSAAHVGKEASPTVGNATTAPAAAPTSTDHPQTDAATSPAVHDSHQSQPVEASNQGNTTSSKASEIPGTGTNPAAVDSAALTALAQLAPQTAPVPTIGSQAMLEMLTQSSHQASQSKVAGVDGASAKTVDGSNPELSAVNAKSSVQDKDGKVAESQQNQSHSGSQDGANTNQDQSSTQFAAALKDHATPLQSVTGASTTSPQVQGVATDHSTKAGVSAETMPSNSAQAHVDASNSSASTQPVVNTARLIQSINGSELKLGMQSDEFGKISITTSATRDTVLAQIYVDHSELAKTLASNLPEMQSRVGGNQSFDIRVATTSGTGGMSANTSSGDTNQQAYQQQRSNQSFTKGIAPISSSISTGSAQVVPETQHASLIDNRLDLRV